MSLNQSDKEFHEHKIIPERSSKSNFIKCLENRALGDYTKNNVNPVEFSSIAEDGLVQKEHKEMKCEIPGIPRSTFLVVFSPDGTKMASTHGNHNIYVTDIKTGKNIKTLIGHPRTPWCVAFHPTSNQIIASGCLGGQVRIWDLSGGSEVWTTESQTVIASIAFHPDDRVLVIATFNELYFWDWSKPEPFMHVATNNVKEKVRYVAFDKLGHKLITGISNSPQARWERVRAPVPIPRQIDRTANTYRRRITPRLILPQLTFTQANQRLTPTRQPLSSVPERERRITQCYRNLVHEYELLVHRFLQIYRPPTMIDQGTDPMEVEQLNSNDNSLPGPSTSGTQKTSSAQQNSNRTNESPGPSNLSNNSNSFNATTSAGAARVSLNSYYQDYFNRREERRRYRISRYFGVNSTQTQSEQSSDTNEGEQEAPENLSTNNRNNDDISGNNESNSPNRLQISTQTHSPCRVLVLPKPTDPSLSNDQINEEDKSKHNINIKCSTKRKSLNSGNSNSAFQATVKKSKENDKEECEVRPSTSQTTKDDVKEKREDRNTGGPSGIGSNNNKWHRTVRKRIHSNNKYYVPSSDSSSSDEDNMVKRRTFLNKKIPKVPQGDSKKKKSQLSLTETLQSTSNEVLPSAPSTSTKTTTNHKDLMNINLELLVTNLICNDNETPTSNATTNVQQEIERICNTCGGTIRLDNSLEHNHLNANQTSENSNLIRGEVEAPSTRTPNLESNVLLSHHPSAFCPLRTTPREAHVQRLPNTDNTEQPLNLSAFHPFDPPPEFVSIHPENIGIGNMYSNIVQELESSLNDVRNIRANNRLGETSDMLSSFSERLESIMNQSNAILRNLHTSIDTILPETTETNQETNDRLPAETARPQLVFNDNSFYVREQRPDPEEDRSLFDSEEILDSSRSQSTSHTAIASDHTYPRNPRTTRNSTTTTMTPLIASLHFTVSHIQRQARLLRQQVESIEHIDRAMLEVAQLQMMRQMFSEIHRYFNSVTANDRNIGVSSVRQMMAGTSISDSNQNSNVRTGNNAGSSNEQEPSTSTNHPSNSASRTRAHKSFPRCIFLMHRQSRRPHTNLRSMSRDRSTRRHLYRRSFSCRAMPRTPIDLSTNRGRGFLNLFNPEALPIMTRRLEHLLMDHGRFIGRAVEPDTTTTNEVGEHIVMLRLNDCRIRMNRIFRDSSNNTLPSTRINSSCVTRDGASRFAARQTLCSILDNLSRFVEANAGNTLSANFRTHIWDVIELSLLLSEILLLQIVDSIPPPTGMNLDPERESLSARIDQMCSRMLQSRLSVQSHQLTRSLRLMRLTVRHATHALGQTYTARRNAMLPSNNNMDRRRQLLDEINVCLQNIRRHRNNTDSSQAHSIPIRNWYRTINDLISRYTTSNRSEENTAQNAPESDEQLEETSDNTQGNNNNVNNSSDSNDYNETDWFNNNVRRENSRTLYRSNHMNLLDSNLNNNNNNNNNNSGDTSSSSPNFNSFSIPTIQVNDYSVNELYSPWRPRTAAILTNRERLSERLSELRTHSTMSSFFRPRFLHPLYAVSNPFDAELEDNQREHTYDSDIITNVTPNHRIQIWEFNTDNIPNINNSLKNIVVSECKIHNDASVDIASDGSMLVTLLPGGYLNITNKLGVYSLEWKTLGQCLYVASFEQNAVSVSLSPINRHLLVGLASRRVIMPNDKWTLARIFLLEKKGGPTRRLLPMRELEQARDANYTSVNCIRWLPVSGQGLVYATNTGQLRILT